MNSDTYTYLLADARGALKSCRLLSALESLKGLASLLKATPEADEVQTVLSAYHMLLGYMVQGANDPSRTAMYRRFVCRSYELADCLERKGVLADTRSFYAARFRDFQTRTGIRPLHDLLSPAADLTEVFNGLWLSGMLSSEEESAVRDYLMSGKVLSEGKCLAISALTLSAMRFFDISKYRILLDCVLVPHAELRARALVGLVFVHLAHPDRLAYYPEVEARLRLMADVPGFGTELEMLQAQLFLSLETKRIERNLRDEILPQMMKRVKDLRLDRSIGLEEIKDKLTEADLNPEWEEDGTPSRLAEYMKEFMELQQRGADMYITTFKMLKQRFPFFQQVYNWFWPFTLNHPEVPETARRSETLKLLLKGAGLCDSDKYSFCLMAGMMPQNEMRGEPGSFMSDNLRQMLAEQEGLLAQPTFKDYLRSYVQGFYRFCHLFIHREDFPNPFKSDLYVVDYPPFDRLLNDGGFLERMADFAFRNKTYPLAMSLYKRIDRKKLKADMCQKLGFCYEQEDDFVHAIDAYDLANSLKPSSEWTLRRLAACYRVTEQYEKALGAYDELAAIHTESASLSLRQAECLIHLNRYDEAFKFLYKADYLDSASGQAVRALAWCSLLTGKYEQAERYYTKVLAGAPTRADWLNAGHAAWLQGHVADAVSRYKRSLPDEEPWRFLENDIPLLDKAGLTADDRSLMTDAVLADAGKL